MAKSLLHKVVYPTEHFGERRYKRAIHQEANARPHSVSKPVRQSSAANDREAGAAHRGGTTPWTHEHETHVLQGNPSSAAKY